MNGINLVLASLFILITILVTSLVSQPNRWKVLLVTGLLFYYWLIGDKIIIVLILSGITYVSGCMIHSGKNVVLLSVLLLLVPLLLLKISGAGDHFNNYQLKVDIASNNWGSLFQIIGLSYFTFNGISYLIDIKRRYISPEKNFFFLLLYLTYFPTIFSGPLHRANYLLGQFKNIEVNDHSISRGLRLILWALFKNLVIAQRIFALINRLQHSEIAGGYYLIIGLLFFLYLYCNFSSFIDFFQGVSLIFNIRLKHNFRNRVYFSASRQEFWRGWHTTLNQWFRDYFFFVLSRYDKKGKYLDVILLITFLLIALWHGFSTVMIVWGTLNGLWIVIEKKFEFEKWKYPRVRKVSGVIYHLSIAACLAIIFISPSASFLYNKVFVQAAELPSNFREQYLVSLLVISGSLVIMDYHYAKAKDMRFEDYLDTKRPILRWLIYAKLVIIILIFGLSTGIDNYYIQF